MLKLDHLAVAATDLEEGRAHIEAALGVATQPGGKHANFGTHNVLLGLEDGIYLEAIAIDPDAPDPGRRRWFDLDDFTGPPRLANWICQTGDIDEALALSPAGMGPATDQRRDDLHWQMAAGENGHLPLEGTYPAVIAWGNTPHPSTRLASTGIRLERLIVTSPVAAALRSTLRHLLADARIVIEQGDKSLRAEFSTPSGRRVLE
ncbi:VOC family protein [Aquicoccus porphyridii]|uniref:VOC family protein n=1 Tax=Aquicoccus porphyridii TaxID=1852029 RepID=A0A5A9ZTU2_9RHOB|nr:VOC family protein [Aquicoccus porphyridii]KAA0920778.1 VOC family protein [Aquicoccus porphyridii]RAI56675.1 VOC family protein [Rhodobacteraceae bacterium AsT-22]